MATEAITHRPLPKRRAKWQANESRVICAAYVSKESCEINPTHGYHALLIDFAVFMVLGLPLKV
jgi:hypothetical protein